MRCSYCITASAIGDHDSLLCDCLCHVVYLDAHVIDWQVHVEAAEAQAWAEIDELLTSWYM